MNTKAKTKLATKVSEETREMENPMQERHLGELTDSVEETAEAVFTARRLEVREEAGPIFVP
jgi:hypothetical protein